MILSLCRVSVRDIHHKSDICKWLVGNVNAPCLTWIFNIWDITPMCAPVYRHNSRAWENEREGKCGQEKKRGSVKEKAHERQGKHANASHTHYMCHTHDLCHAYVSCVTGITEVMRPLHMNESCHEMRYVAMSRAHIYFECAMSQRHVPTYVLNAPCRNVTCPYIFWMPIYVLNAQCHVPKYILNTHTYFECDMSQCHVPIFIDIWTGSFTYISGVCDVTGLIHEYVMWLVSSTNTSRMCHVYEWAHSRVVWRIRMGTFTCMNESCHVYMYIWYRRQGN